MRAPVAFVAASLALAAPAAGAGNQATFADAAWGLVVRYPAALAVSTRFRPNYLDSGAWRVSYAAGAGAGTPIAAFVLPDLTSDDPKNPGMATAELRIGASRDPDTLATCLSYGMNSGNNVEQRTRVIGGLTFNEVPDNSDAAMMQTIATDDLRAVDHGTCWAIDIVLYARATTDQRPEYPPAQIALLGSVLDGISFGRPAFGKP